jgi:hypothetical protein
MESANAHLIGGFINMKCASAQLAYLLLCLLLLHLFVAANQTIHSTHRHHNIGIVAAHPRLVMQTGRVEGFARVWKMAVVLLQNLVKSGEVKVDILLKPKKRD